MRQHGSKPRVLSELCEVHKKPDQPNRLPPLHPILSAIGICLYNLAKCFVSILKEFTINNTQSRIFFHFHMKFVTKALAYIWLPLTSSLYSPIYQ